MTGRFILSALLLVVAGTVSSCQQPIVNEHTETIEGVDYTLTIYGHSRKQGDRATEAVFAELRLLAGLTDPMHSKAIARTNVLLQGGEWFSVNPSVTQILKQSIRYYTLTGGLFNPAILGALKEKYGFYGTATPTAPSNQRELQNFLVAPPTMKDVNFDGIRLQGTHPGIRLDFDYLAYGYAIDIEIEHLRELGIENATLRVGDVQRVMGPEAKRRHPFSFRTASGQGNSVLAPGGSAFCERTAGAGPRLILHPVTGQPVSQVRSIQLTADTASDASVACWVLMAGSPDQWQQLAARIGVTAAVLESSDGQYHVWTSTAQ